MISIWSLAKPPTNLKKILKDTAQAGKYDCYFWASYPKLTGEIKSDLKREVVWDIMLEFGLRCVSQISLNETWSALRGRPPEKVGK
ncbi:MAG: hypothetical protein HW421_3815 [Ignavibacteria bacterium]|nr:hypothetical protein [Ignavibacteria bacterium]